MCAPKQICQKERT